jgi:hypothetical protein
MPMWYELLEDDKQFNAVISNEMRKSTGKHSNYNNHFIRQILEDIGYMQRVDGYGTSPYGYGHNYPTMSQIDPRQLGDKELNTVVGNIGEALFMTLVECNPLFAKRLLTHGLQCGMDDELRTLQEREDKRRHSYRGVTSPTSQPQRADFVTPARRPALENDDYEYWWDYSECGSVIYVMSDYDGTPATGLIEIEFDPNDADEVEDATFDAEDTVRKLTTGELNLDDLVNKSKHLESRSNHLESGSAMEVAMKQQPMIDWANDASNEFSVAVTNRMVANLRDDIDKRGILGDFTV